MDGEYIAKPEIFTPVIGETVDINKVVIFGLNAFFMLLYVIRNFTVQGLVTYLVATPLILIVVVKSSDVIPAIVHLPFILVADVITYIGVNFLDLKSMVNMEGHSSYFLGAAEIFLIVFSASLMVGLVGIANKKLYWITNLAGGLIGVSVILIGWSNNDVNNFKFTDDGAALVLLFVILDMLWTVILYIIVKTVPEKTTGAFWIGVVLLCVFIAGLIIGTDYVKEVLPAWKAGLIECPHTIFAWWKVILSTGIILAGIFILYKIDGAGGNYLSVDTYALVVVGEIILTTKILMSNYFSFNGLILIGLLVGTFICMKNDYTGKKTLGLDSIVYLPAQYFVALLAIFLFKKGLWINVVVSLIFFIAFYVNHNKLQKARSNTPHWVMILLCVVSEAVALIWRNHYSFDLVIVLAMVLGAGIFTILVINIRQPGGRTAPNILRIIVCVCVVIICLAATSRKSVIIDYITDDSNKNVTVNVETKGRDNSIASAHYYWRDVTGKVIKENIDIPRNEYTIPKESEVLTVVVEDARGFTSSKIIWFPQWLHTFIE